MKARPMKSYRVRTNFTKADMILAIASAEAAMVQVEASHVGRSGPANWYAAKRKLRRIIDGSTLEERTPKNDQSNGESVLP